jgi:glutathione S-transferase
LIGELIEMPMKLYGHLKNYKTHKALIAAQYVELDIATIPDEAGQTITGKIPVLETDQGCIFTSIAIARYISRLRRDIGLYGQNLIEGGMIDSWVEFCTHELEIPLSQWVFPKMGLLKEDPEATAQAKEDVRRSLGVLNNHLLHHTFLVGNSVTLADICVACALHDGLRLVLDEKFRAPFTNLMRWHALVTSQPQFVAVLGEAQLCGKATSAAPAKAGKAAGEVKKDAAPKAEAKDQIKPKENKKDKKAAAKPEPSPKKEDKPQPSAEEEKKKKLKKVVKEGGKRGVEIDGAADMGGLQFFCTSVDEPEGDLELLRTCMDAMNAESDPAEEERKGGSGRIGKMIFSAGDHQLAVLAYIPEALKDSIDAKEWLQKVLDLFQGEVAKASTSVMATGFIKADGDKNKFPLKMKEPCITEAITFLKAKGLFPDKDDDSDDEFVFGDDDFPS